MTTKERNRIIREKDFPAYLEAVSKIDRKTVNENARDNEVITWWDKIPSDEEYDIWFEVLEDIFPEEIKRFDYEFKDTKSNGNIRLRKITRANAIEEEEKGDNEGKTTTTNNRDNNTTGSIQVETEEEYYKHQHDNSFVNVKETIKELKELGCSSSEIIIVLAEGLTIPFEEKKNKKEDE